MHDISQTLIAIAPRNKYYAKNYAKNVSRPYKKRVKTYILAKYVEAIKNKTV